MAFKRISTIFSKPSVVPSSDGGLFGKPLVNIMRDCVRIPQHHHTTAYMYEVMTPDFDRRTKMLLSTDACSHGPWYDLFGFNDPGRSRETAGDNETLGVERDRATWRLEP